MSLSINQMIEYLNKRILEEKNLEWKNELEFISISMKDWYKSITYQNFKEKRYSLKDELKKYNS
jgi:hypothetical protein